MAMRWRSTGAAIAGSLGMEHKAELMPEDKVAAIKNPVKSNNRDTSIAREMGARYAISGEVQKVSNLILSVNLHVRDAETGATVRAGAAAAMRSSAARGNDCSCPPRLPSTEYKRSARNAATIASRTT